MSENEKPRFPEIGLSVILPAYNEEMNIRRTVPRAIESLRRMVGRAEVLLINDKSTDTTGAIADELSQSYPELRVVHNEKNLRQGGCLRVGFAMASLDFVTHNALDYPFDFDDLPALISVLPDADIVVAGRRTYPGITLPRRFVSLANRVILRGLFGAPIRDYNFVQIYRRSVLRELPSISEATSFITAEKIIRAHRRKMRVIEIEVDYHRRVAGKPSSANLRNIRRALEDMAKLWIDLRREESGGR